MHGSAKRFERAKFASSASKWAWNATPSPGCNVPVSVQSGLKPVIAVPGLTPTSPVMADAPVQVTVEEPRMAKLAAEPSDGACAQHMLLTLNMKITNKSFFISKLLGWISLYRR